MNKNTIDWINKFENSKGFNRKLPTDYKKFLLDMKETDEKDLKKELADCVPYSTSFEEEAPVADYYFIPPTQYNVGYDRNANFLWQAIRHVHHMHETFVPIVFKYYITNCYLPPKLILMETDANAEDYGAIYLWDYDNEYHELSMYGGFPKVPDFEIKFIANSLSHFIADISISNNRTLAKVA